ncbi:hypothetical protein [Flavisolibacter nicotianae]|uniref:hypothetical protein n=1 Tax=Flavisolibacter nicotianae TaxID=2364882 RepID=UPI000EAE43F6|nr:hypothetical protein [Flavisolibacter nicotianae]
MTILFDLEILEPEFYRNGLTFEEKIVFEEIRKYMMQRFSALSEEMNKEESQKTCAVIIHLLPLPEGSDLPEHLRKNPINIAIRGYSSNLRDKLHASFTQTDVEIIEQRLQNVLSRLGN